MVDHFQPKTTAELVNHFDRNLSGARKALAASDESLEEPFQLKNDGHLFMTLPKKDNIGPTTNHLAHHRDQLTVSLRLNYVPVPPVCGPTADESGF